MQTFVLKIKSIKSATYYFKKNVIGRTKLGFVVAIICLMFNTNAANAQGESCVIYPIPGLFGDEPFSELCTTSNVNVNNGETVTITVRAAYNENPVRGLVSMNLTTDHTTINLTKIDDTSRSEYREASLGSWTIRTMKYTYVAPTSTRKVLLRFRFTVRFNVRTFTDRTSQTDIFHTVRIPFPGVNTQGVFTGDVNYTSARVTGFLVRGDNIIGSLGFVYSSTNKDPKIGSKGVIKTSITVGRSFYEDTFTGLTPGTMYYYRFYAIDQTSTVYGGLHGFKTLGQRPTVETKPTIITLTSVTLNGNITSNGGVDVTERGFVYSTSNTDLTTDNTAGTVVVSGIEIGAFSKDITGLTENTLYYYKAYATNNVNTSYGVEISFTTLATAIAPTVSTTDASAITDTSVTLSGSMAFDGGETISERGFVYSTSNTDLTTDNTAGTVVVSGIEIGDFSKVITGLTKNTLYYYKAYATNNVNTSYGVEISFTTLATAVLSLNKGWNLVGFNVEPADNSIANVFASVGSLVQIKTESKSYDPSLTSLFNSLALLENGQGYFIKLNIASQITLTGTRITLTEISIPLSVGWNLISYPSENMADIETALSNISQYITEVKTQTKSYNPALSVAFNTLNQLEPSKGYWIKVSQNCNLTF